MANHISFPSIEQFRHVVKLVRDRSSYHGNMTPPTLSFQGSVKLHGTNSAIVKNFGSGEIWSQSRTSIITPNNDNAGFAKFAIAQAELVNKLFNAIEEANVLTEASTVAIYGEWCGQGIAKGSNTAINQVSKRFVIFGIQVRHDAVGVDLDIVPHVWLNHQQLTEIGNTLGSCLDSVFVITMFPTWTIDIDFVNPGLVQNKLQDLTLEVERCCPVSKMFGVEGIGEGVVWVCNDQAAFKTSDLTFKVKGEKHSDSRVKTLAAVDVEKLNSISEFAQAVVTDHRLEKMLDLLNQAGHTLEPKSIPQFLKLVGDDVVKEESDTMDASGLARKEVMQTVNRLAREWFLTIIRENPL